MGSGGNKTINTVVDTIQQIVYPSTIPERVVPPFDNVKKFASYTDLEQQMFYALRQGMLTMFPTLSKDKQTVLYDGSGSFETISIQQAELFASTVVDNWPTELKIVQQVVTNNANISGNTNNQTGG
jgi:hypothetical protein